MAIELHHLNTHGMMKQACDVLDGVVRLKERIAELEKENESLKYSVAALETDLAMSKRWRKCSEELPPDGEAVAVCFHAEDGRLITSVDCLFDEEWQMMDDCEGYWMPLPSAPKEEK